MLTDNTNSVAAAAASSSSSKQQQQQQQWRGGASVMMMGEGGGGVCDSALHFFVHLLHVWGKEKASRISSLFQQRPYGLSVSF
jgi:hypothetical protein